MGDANGMDGGWMEGLKDRMAYFDWGKCYCYLPRPRYCVHDPIYLGNQVVCSWWKAPLPPGLGLSGNRGEGGHGWDAAHGSKASGETSRPVIARVTFYMDIRRRQGAHFFLWREG